MASLASWLLGACGHALLSHGQEKNLIGTWHLPRMDPAEPSAFGRGGLHF